MSDKRKNNYFGSFLAFFILLLICLAFFVFQNKELMKKREKENEEVNLDMNGAGWTVISQNIEKEDEIEPYIVRTLDEIFNKYMGYIADKNEEAIVEINNSGNTCIAASDAKRYKIDEIYRKEQNYSYTFFISCSYSNNEYYYLIDMDTSNKTFRFEELDKDTFVSAKNGSVPEKYDYRVFVKKGNYNTFKFNYSD